MPALRVKGKIDARASGGQPFPEKDREFICEKCGKRCTRGTTPDLEYGHRYGCPDRPDSLPTGDRSEFDRYKRGAGQ